MVSPVLAKVCVSQNMVVTEQGVLRMAPWSVPRLVADQRADSAGDGAIGEQSSLPGKLMIEAIQSWKNDTPVDHSVLIRITRSFKNWITTNPNAIQFRDRWTHAIDGPVTPPVTTSIYNGQVGSAVDITTNTVAEPNAGIYEYWWGTNSSDEWIGPIEPGQTLNVWYRCYVWTPPPWSNNANRSHPFSWAAANWARLQLIVYPQQGDLVAG